MKRLVLTLFACIALVFGLSAQPAAAIPPTFPFTTDHAYCKGAFHDIGAETWLRTYIRTQTDGTGHVVTSIHPAAWSQDCSGLNGSEGCGGHLNDPATQNGRLRIYAVFADGSSVKIMDRSFNLTDANKCDYVAGTTNDWSVNANEVHVRWDYDLKIDNAAGDENGESMMIWRKVVNGGPDSWGCEFNGSIVRAGDDCTTGDAI